MLWKPAAYRRTVALFVFAWLSLPFGARLNAQTPAAQTPPSQTPPSQTPASAAPQNQPSPNQTPQKDEPTEAQRRSTAVALNYCRASFHRIRRYPSKRVLLEEQEQILNNLNLNGIADEEVIRLYGAVLDEIGQVQLADRERVVLKDKYNSTLRRQLGLNTFVFGTQLATAQLGSAVRTGVTSWWDFRDIGSHRDLDMWRIEKDRVNAVADKSSRFLDTFWKLAQKKKIPDRWLVRGSDLDRLEAALHEPNLEVRLRVLKRMERFMECYPPYWYHLARTQQALGLFPGASQTYRQLAELAEGHFRIDDMLAAGLANRTAILEHLNDPEAAETARTALRFSTGVWQANVICARVLERHGCYDEAEDALLRNLDVDLERHQSLTCLLSLYYQTGNERRLAERLSDPSVVRDVPLPVVLQCAARLGADKLPMTTFNHLMSSIQVTPQLTFGPDDLIVSADSDWQLHTAQVQLQIGEKRFSRPAPAAPGSSDLRFRGVVELGHPMSPSPAAGNLPVALIIKYPDTPEVRLEMKRIAWPTETAETSPGGNSLFEVRRVAASRPPESFRIAGVEMNESRLSLLPTVSDLAIVSPAGDRGPED